MQIAAPVLAPLRLRTLRERNARADLAERLGQPPTAPGAVGVELEFVVVAGDEPVDFRRVLPSLDLGRPRLDPDDAFARRLPTGSVITCDGREAEVSVAPVEIRRGFASAVTRDAQAAADALDAALPVGLSLRGYSTHISIEVPNDRVVEVGRTFVTRFGPRLRALMDGPEEPGLRVRPRFHRLELCGDFASGARLEAAVIHAAGGVAACLLAGSGDPFATPLPEEVRASVRPAIERPGWFIDKAAVASAWGADTYELARGGYARVADHDESSAAVVTAGIRHLLETSRSGVGDPGARGLISTSPSDYGRAISPTFRPGFDLAPVMVTWPVSVFLALLHGQKLPRFIVVPRAWLGQFLHRLDRGELDGAITRDLTSKRTRRIARDWRDARLPAVFDAVPSRLALLPPEPM